MVSPQAAAEHMGEHITWVERILAEVDAYKKAWKDRRWFAVGIGVGAIVYCIYSGYSMWVDGKQVKKLEGEKSQLETKLQDLERKNENLSTVVAPLLARAAKEFPGEEINKSLKKVVERLEAESPANKPLASASATAEVVIDATPSEQEHAGTRDMTAGAYVALVDNSPEPDALIIATTGEWRHSAVGTNAVRHSGDFTLNPKSKMIGKPLKELAATEFIQLEFWGMAKNQKVKSGNVTVILNGNIRMEFDVPAQVSQERVIVVRGVQNQIREALQCNQGA